MRHLRVHLLVIAALAAAAVTLAPGRAAAAPPPGSENAYAEGYHRLLLQHTRWAETTWDEQAGHYELANTNFSVVLGNAVVLEFGTYDAELAGVPAATLRDHTLRTIERFAASNRWVDPDGDWGRNVYFNSTFEAYFVAAARLLWDDLDAQTRANVDTITARGADHVVDIGLTPDPFSLPDWSTNGLEGGFRGNSKIEEMGTRTMPLATALAHLPQDDGSADWREWMNRWTLNMGGLPPADEANPAVVDGRTVADWNQAHNVYDSFIVENHGSYSPIYQESMGAYPGRNAVQFLIAGRPLPEGLVRIPNGDELWETLAHLGMDSGLSAHPMVADRYHLYGRDILPLAYRTTVLGDRYAARAERMLLDHLGPYVNYPPANRLTKFSGQPSYEPEARAELAIAYLLHYWRDSLAGDVEPVSARELFTEFSRAKDYGADVGLLAHQTPDALSAAVTKPGHTKFAYLPQHDDWLFDPSAANPSLLPSAGLALTGREAAVYRKARDGFDGSATLVRTASGHAGFTTLPRGQAVYATSGLGAGEGALRLFNLDMPGVPGLDGDRTFTTAEGAVTLKGGGTGGVGDGGRDEVAFDPVTARHVRFLGVQRAGGFGYSLFGFALHDGAGADLAQGRPATASSFDARFPPGAATDGDPQTRWAVSAPERTRNDSWLAVDLGAPRTFDRAVLDFEAAYAVRYRIQVSDDGATWRDVAAVAPTTAFDSSWLNVDGRAGFVVRGSENPIAVGASGVTLSDGPAEGSAGMVVEARPGEAPGATARAAEQPAPGGGPEALRASLAGGHLSLFNLSDAPIEGADLRLPQNEPSLFRGVQRTVDGGTVYAVSLSAARAAVEPPRFTLRGRRGDVPAGLELTVEDSRTVHVRNVAGPRVAQLELAAVGAGERRPVTVPAGKAKTVHFRRPALTPSADLAATRTTFPTSPLPAGMSDPDLAVDGDDSTTWRPGPDGRMVVDLGAVHSLGRLELRFGRGRVAPLEVEVSDDGLAYRPAGRTREAQLGLGTSARYVAVRVPGWRPGDAEIATVTVTPGVRIGAIAPVDVAEPGGSATVAAEVENPGRTPVEDVTADLHGPEGWTVAATAPGPDRLDGGERARWDWRLTAPVGAAPGRYQATVTVRYLTHGESVSVSRDLTVRLGRIPHERMTATTDSEQVPNGEASRAIDGDPTTLWHSQFNPFEPLPHQITLDLGSAHELTEIEYLPRQDGNRNGTITRYRVEVSAGGDEWTVVTTGTWPNDAALKSARWERVTGRYVRLVAEAGSGGFASAAELDVYGALAE